MNNRLNRAYLPLTLSLAAVLATSCSDQGHVQPLAAIAGPAGPAVTATPDRSVKSMSTAWIQDTFGEKLVRQDGTQLSTDALKGKKVGIYFSAHWCPPCRAFSPELVKVYNAIKKKGQNFEIVLVSSDRNAKEMFNYMREADMPWVAIPHDSPLRTQLGEHYGVQGIPTLVVVDERGRTVTKEGREAVMSQRAEAFQAW